MSRFLRSALTSMQTASAGPSTQSSRIAHPLSGSIPRTAASHPPRMPALRFASSSRSILDDPEVNNATTSSSNEISRSQGGTGAGLFDDVEAAQQKEVIAAKEAKRASKVFNETTHKTKTHNISPRKLQLLSTQIAGLPIDEAIIQMQFSNKMAGRWIKSELVQARNNAVLHQGATRDKLVVSQSWVSKGKYGPKRIDIKGRGRHGVMRSPYARITVLLKHGQTADELAEIKFLKMVNRLGRSAGLVREDRNLSRKVISGWHW